MPESRYPTLDEFWRRLDRRRVEPDLAETLRGRTAREMRGTPRLGEDRGAAAVAVGRRLLPSAAVPPEALASFLDWSHDRQLGRGDEQVGLLPTAELVPAGLDALNRAAQQRYDRRFDELGEEEQDSLLADAEGGDLELPEEPRFDSAVWFKRTRSKLLLGYGSDPRGMVEMGFPGPTYETGHVWLDRAEVKARARRRVGYEWL
jgi:Gluconate 2-dehydrogenase subunit 3